MDLDHIIRKELPFGLRSHVLCKQRTTFDLLKLVSLRRMPSLPRAGLTTMRAACCSGICLGAIGVTECVKRGPA